MSPDSSGKLSIVSGPQTVNFYVGEILIPAMPKLKFGLDWYIGDPFMRFCNETIVLAFENLLINEVLICRTEEKTKSFLYFFKYTRKVDYFSLNKALSLADVGFIEMRIAKVVPAGKWMLATMTIELLIYRVFEVHEKMTNPWREFLKRLIGANRLRAWTHQYHQRLLGGKMEVVLQPSMERELESFRNAVSEQCAQERLSNAEFADLSARLSGIVEKLLDDKKPADSGS